MNRKSKLAHPNSNFQMVPMRVLVALAALIAITSSLLLTLLPAHAQTADTFPDLASGQRVYDETATSLTSEQITGLEQQLSDLQAEGADAIVYVRNLNATPDETLAQVEALQQAWVALTGADQDNAVAILINRDPNDPNEARAGIYVGSTFNDGNVPRGEQRDIVSEALIPPLRNGDVYTSLSAGLTRLESSIHNGPPRSAFEKWASRAASSWLLWVDIALSAIGLGAVAALFRRRETTEQLDLEPTTTRPGTLTPALAGALVTGSPQVSAVPATMLDLAARNALDIVPESEGGTFTKPTIQVRLQNQNAIKDDVETALWIEMEKHAENGVVTSKNLVKVSTNSKQVRQVIKNQMRDEQWLNPSADRDRGLLFAMAMLAGLLAVGSLVITGIAGELLPAIGIAALAALAVIALILYGTYSALTQKGQEAAIPWKAYRQGIERAAKDDTVALDLNATLADAIAMNLGAKLSKRLKHANDSGQMLDAFMASTGPSQGNQAFVAFPFWIAFQSSVSTSSGSGGVVSGGGAGGGGGAAGST